MQYGFKSGALLSSSTPVDRGSRTVAGALTLKGKRRLSSSARFLVCLAAPRPPAECSNGAA